MAFTLPALPLRLTDTNGNPLSGGKMYVFEAGTTTPVDIYTDSALAVPATNPLVADSGGLFAETYLAVGSYKIRFQTAAGVTIWETDDYVVASESSQISFPTSVKTANFAITASDRGKVFLVDASGPGTITASSDTSDLGSGFPVFIVNTGATGTVTLIGTGGQTVDGAASKDLSTQYASLGVVSLGAAGWQTVMSSNSGDFTTPVSFSSTVTFADGHSIVGGPLVLPGGRLTITAATPVIVTDTTAQTTVYYTPYQGNRIAIPTADGWTSGTFAEVSQTLADVAKSPGAAAASSLYDIFGWLDGTTFRSTRGPAWSSSTSRGTGAGTSELQFVDGMWVNKVAITNGPAANRGVYLGTISTSATGANGQLNMMLAPAAAAGGSANRIDLWNAFNRRAVSSLMRDSTDSWTYGTNTWRAANNSTSNRVTFVRGLDDECVIASYRAQAFADVNEKVRCAVGVDSTSAISGIPAVSEVIVGSSLTLETTLISTYEGCPGIGSHFVQALEWSDATGTFYGDNAEPLNTQMGLIYRGMA